MTDITTGTLDAVFGALSHPTRRGVLAELAAGPRPVSGLARPFRMSLPGFIKHLRILEQAKLVELRKQGRVVHCTLSAGPMKEAAEWLARYQSFWSERLDALARFLETEAGLTGTHAGPQPFGVSKEKEKEPWQQSVRRRPSRLSAASRSSRKKSGGRGPTRH